LFDSTDTALRGRFFIGCRYHDQEKSRQKKARHAGLVNKGMKKRELVLSFFILIKTIPACHAFCMTGGESTGRAA